MSSLISHATLQPARWAFLGTGFRPFFWLGALMGSSWMFLWLLLLQGHLTIDTLLPLPYWHAHEMLFGFVVAAIAGFLLTAVRNWTGRPTAAGPSLFFLVLLWVAGRAAMLSGAALPTPAVIAIDMAFIPGLLFFVARPIIAARHTRSIGVLVILGVLATCNLLVHLGGAGYLPRIAVPTLLQATVNIIVLLMVIIGGRIIPAFTRNTLPQTPIYRFVWLDRLAIGSVVLLFITESLAGMGALTGATALAAGALNTLRLLCWGGYKTLTKPLLWILHLGYLWICLGLISKGLDGYLPGTYRGITTHLLTAGAMSTLILGMMSRVSLGHTGRPLQLPRRMVSSYLLLTLGALVRVAGPLLFPAYIIGAWLLSGGLWIAAFIVFLCQYTAILWQPRVDGRPG